MSDVKEAVLRCRQRVTSTDGPITMDTTLSRWRCKSCEEEFFPPELDLVCGADYRTRDQFVGEVIRGARGTASNPERAQRCPDCDGEAWLAGFEQHAYHALRQRDLVVCCERTKPTAIWKPRVYWWSLATGYEPVGERTDEDEISIALGALLRETQALDRDPDPFAKLDEIASFAWENATAPHMIELVPFLVRCEHYQPARQICRAQVDLDPRDPRPFFWIGEIICEAVNRELIEDKTLEIALITYRDALLRDPRYVDAQTGIGNCHRMRGDLDAARDAYKSAFDMDPSDATSIYNLAVMELENGHPEAALPWFQRGATVTPDDPDYIAGEARALVALGRLHEATAATDRLRTLAPNHDRLPALEDALSGLADAHDGAK